MSIASVLPPVHTSPETAYLVNDYPFGFRLRCKIRYWIEHKPSKGYRFCSQTTDPRRGNTTWNKPKCGTYSMLSTAMYLDDNGHTQHASLTEYSDLDQINNYLLLFRSGLSISNVRSLEHAIKLKTVYER